MNAAIDPSLEGSFRRDIFDWHRGRFRFFPWRATRDPYEVLIGEILLQRTRGEHVVEVYKELVERWPTPQRLARARVGTISKVIRPLGLAKRAALISRMGRDLAGLDAFPTEPDRLLRITGVGPYAAHAVPVFAMDKDLPIVDWVIARVLRRYFGLAEGVRPNADKDLWELASRLARPGQARALWLGVLDFAASVCRPRPRCLECPLAESCARVQSLDVS
jgi:A/G-specific adenine glycosylase